MTRTGLLAEIGALVGNPGRANMLSVLLDGRALTARELAASAGVTPQTASGHLGRLIAAHLITVEKQGRHRYHRLASSEVAEMLEGMISVAEAHGRDGRAPIRVGPKDAALRRARTCYDHLAGRLGVGLAQTLLDCGHLDQIGDGGRLSPEGRSFMTTLGVDVDAAQAAPRPFCKACLDWSERRAHLGGGLGAALMQRIFELQWLQRLEGTRAVAITRKGEQGFREMFGLRDLRD